MSWVCPHQTDDGQCRLRKKKCKPFAKGCVLSKKFKPVGSNDNSDDENKDKKGK